MSGWIIGIDLGTVNSCVAVVQDGRAVVLGEGKDRTIPSCLAFNAGKEIVGRAARRHAVTDPANTVTAVKRLLGHAFDSPEVQAVAEHSPYPIRPSPLGTVMLEVGGRELTPVQVSSRVLQRIKEIAESALGEPIDKAVISVPAHFNDVQRKATKLAAEYAGIDVLRLINEPTAAAFAYGYRNNTDCTLAVYDLGGGTFDITVMRAVEDTFQVLATDGDSYLGGEDFDKAIETWLAAEFETEFSASLAEDSAALLRVKEAAEAAKIELADVEQTTIDLPFLTKLPDGSQPQLTRTLTREKAAELVAPLVERTLDLCRRCLEEAGVASSEINDVLLVGGQSRMDAVREGVRGFFDREPRRDVNPDEVVAMGAALYGYSLCADDLRDRAAGSATEEYAVALKGEGIARKLLDEIKQRGKNNDQTGGLKARLEELLAETDTASGPDLDADLPSVREAARKARENADRLAAAAMPELDDEELPSLPDSLPELQEKGRNLPNAVRDMQVQLKELSAEVGDVLEDLADEIGDDTFGGGEDVLNAAASQLSSMLEDAAEAVVDAGEHVQEASQHAKARRVDLIDVTSHTLGIEAAGDLFTSLVDQNTPIPVESKRVYTTNQDGQQEVHIRVLQGRGGRHASENTLLGDFVLEGIEAAARMEPKIEVGFAIDADGILSVRARDKKSGAAQAIRIEDPLGLQQASAKDLGLETGEEAEAE